MQADNTRLCNDGTFRLCNTEAFAENLTQKAGMHTEQIQLSVSGAWENKSVGHAPQI